MEIEGETLKKKTPSRSGSKRKYSSSKSASKSGGSKSRSQSNSKSNSTISSRSLSKYKRSNSRKSNSPISRQTKFFKSIQLNYISKTRLKAESEIKCHFYIKNVYFPPKNVLSMENFLKQIQYRVSKAASPSLVQIFDYKNDIATVAIGMQYDEDASLIFKGIKNLYLANSHNKLIKHEVELSRGFRAMLNDANGFGGHYYRISNYQTKNYSMMPKDNKYVRNNNEAFAPAEENGYKNYINYDRDNRYTKSDTKNKKQSNKRSSSKSFSSSRSSSAGFRSKKKSKPEKVSKKKRSRSRSADKRRIQEETENAIKQRILEEEKRKLQDEYNLELKYCKRTAYIFSIPSDYTGQDIVKEMEKQGLPKPISFEFEQCEEGVEGLKCFFESDQSCQALIFSNFRINEIPLLILPKRMRENVCEQMAKYQMKVYTDKNLSDPFVIYEQFNKYGIIVSMFFEDKDNENCYTLVFSKEKVINDLKLDIGIPLSDGQIAKCTKVVKHVSLKRLLAKETLAVKVFEYMSMKNSYRQSFIQDTNLAAEQQQAVGLKSSTFQKVKQHEQIEIIEQMNSGRNLRGAKKSVSKSSSRSSKKSSASKSKSQDRPRRGNRSQVRQQSRRSYDKSNSKDKYKDNQNQNNRQNYQNNKNNNNNNSNNYQRGFSNNKNNNYDNQNYNNNNNKGGQNNQNNNNNSYKTRNYDSSNKSYDNNNNNNNINNNNNSNVRRGRGNYNNNQKY